MHFDHHERRRLIGLTASAMTALILAACAPVMGVPQVDASAAKAEAEKQRVLVVRSYFKNLTKVHSLAYGILRHGAELCREEEDLGYKTGLVVGNKYSLGENYKKAMFDVLGAGEAVQIMVVAANSPAEKAGLRVGDQIISIGDRTATDGEDAEGEFLANLDEVVEEFIEQKKRPILSLRIKRGGKTHAINVEPELNCRYNVVLQQDQSVNAFADGDKIYITTGMVRFAENDTELATVIGHEIAHNLMGHIGKKKGNAAIGLIFDLLFAGLGVNTQGAFSNIAAGAYSQEFEAEADYVGLYLLANTGADISNAPNFWRRMAVNQPASIKNSHTSTHPATPNRFLALEKTVAEINAKRLKGAPLVPEKAPEQPDEPTEPEETQ